LDLLVKETAGGAVGNARFVRDGLKPALAVVESARLDETGERIAWANAGMHLILGRLL
jgi:hypothetical protein